MVLPGNLVLDFFENNYQGKREYIAYCDAIYCHCMVDCFGIFLDEKNADWNKKII